MCKEPKFFLCNKCGNIVEKIEDAGIPVFCCGEPMEELIANTVEASNEKHIPVIETEGDKVFVTVGSVDHPMTVEHHIPWVYLQTESGSQRKCLEIGGAPKACFKICEDDTLKAAYAYCNLHGLWIAKA